MMLTVRNAIKTAFSDAVFWVEAVNQAERQRLERHKLKIVKLRAPLFYRTRLCFSCSGVTTRRSFAR